MGCDLAYRDSARTLDETVLLVAEDRLMASVVGRCVVIALRQADAKEPPSVVLRALGLNQRPLSELIPAVGKIGRGAPFDERHICENPSANQVIATRSEPTTAYDPKPPFDGSVPARFARSGYTSAC